MLTFVCGLNSSLIIIILIFVIIVWLERVGGVALVQKFRFVCLIYAYFKGISRVRVFIYTNNVIFILRRREQV